MIQEMRILSVRPKDVYLEMEMSMSSCEDILLALENCKITLDLSKEEGKRADKAIHSFYEFLSSTIQEIKGNGTRSNSEGIES
jgi:CRISPR/Cas system CSM-associated protein Csm2 small subunit